MSEIQNPAILYVEDNAASRKIIRMLLTRRLGYEEITIFDDSDDFERRALEIEPKPDIVFLDIHVEPHNGFEMLAILRRLTVYNNTKIVALTASVMNDEVQQLRDAGFDGCFSKPIDMDTFSANIQEVLQGKAIWEITG